MSENRRGPEVPEVEVPVVECLDGFARITSKELAPIHSVKSGTLQNACSSRLRAVADLGKSARMHIVRLMNNLIKSPKISVPTLLVVRSVEGGVRIQSQFLFKFCMLNVPSFHDVSFNFVFLTASLIW